MPEIIFESNKVSKLDKNMKSLSTNIESKDKVEIKFEGAYINISDWVDRHPGGNKVLRAFHMKDATDVIRAVHSDEALSQVQNRRKLCSLNDQTVKLKNPKINQNNNLLTPEQLAYKNLLEDLKFRGFFIPSWKWELFKSIYTFGFYLLGMWLLIATDKCILGMCFLSFGWFQLGWLAHDWSHHTALRVSKTSATKICDYGAHLVSIARGNSLLWWKLRHNTHHVLCNQRECDPDIKTSPLLHFFEDFEIDSVNQFQSIYYIPLLCLLHFYWMFESWQVCYKYFNSKNKHTAELARVGAVCMMLHTLIMIATIYYSNKLLYIIFAYFFSGLGTALIVFASHYNEPRIEADVLDLSLLRQTSITTINTCLFSNSKLEAFFWFHFTGGLNLQIEHHLFPMMPRHNLIKTVPAVKALFAEFGLVYKESSLWGCTFGAVDRLASNARRNACEKTK